MHGLLFSVALLLIDSCLAAAISTPSTAIACPGNTPDTRSLWCDYDISTNYYHEVPDTGVTRTYYFEVQNTTAAPDGIERPVQLINGSFPGPTIEANWGDTVVVHVTNAVANNGTGIHFHGIRQNYTNHMDGVPSITQCPIAPSDTLTYTWRATQYGTSWYHSHFSLQAWDGVFGGMVIHGPATANYDEEIGFIFLNDWDHETIDSQYAKEQTSGPPTLATGLINGMNVYNHSGTQVGRRFETTVEPGKQYLMRVLNAAIDSHFTYSIDNHTMKVIAADLVPIVPYTTKTLSIGIGQRYDVIISADQEDVASDFWIRAVPDEYCSANNNGDDIKGILHYGASTGMPSTTAYPIPDNSCRGEPLASTVPHLSIDAADASISSDLDVTLAPNNANIYKWYVNDTTFLMDWGSPTAQQLLNGNDTRITPNRGSSATHVSRENEWAYFIIETTDKIPHPMHLHGHDFFVLAAGEGNFDPATVALNHRNPPRRDTTMLYGDGYLVIAMKADNPGVWLFHCHIAWHTLEGLAMQIIDQGDEVAALYDRETLDGTCEKWNAWQDSVKLEQDDAGI